ncbi:Methyltransferase OMS1, mitochondrial [Choanephora cucurbitarum]|uniref:Methyltransferase OMS1, mitochondrial n=1 Tax=Choanephora cucurbitarum TaxID=101091 RepID=A0A1C7NEF3_9FUNG|nr:Methyltransferase OMS1, mitochondrial [Choanephora cucurbitarum]
MSTRKAFTKAASAGLKYKPINTPKPTPAPSPKPKPKLGPVLMGGAVLYVSAAYVSMLVFKSKNDTNDMVSGKGAQDPSLTPSSFDTANIWQSVAKKYDQEIGWDEIVMGVGLLRRWLIGKAQGDVLEVSTGTGRNFDYYKPNKVQSATFTDRHEPMLDEAKAKFLESYKDRFHQAFFETVSIEEKKTKKYDTVVDTFGLCSCGDPVEALVQMADSCRSEESRVLLLEHGRSHYDWLNRLLDSNADKHVKQWGCWWNRDIMSLFEDERVKQKLEVVEHSRWHLGTTCFVVAKPKKEKPE